jgi:hypothetical protein
MADGGIVGYAKGDGIDASTMEGIQDFYLGDLAEAGERRRKEQKAFLEEKRRQQAMDELTGNNPQAMRMALANLQQGANYTPPARSVPPTAAPAGVTSGTPTPAATPAPTPSGATAEDLTSPYTQSNYVPLGPGIEATVRQLVPGVTVTSRNRTAKKNESVGGVSQSYHLLDSARDFVPGNSGLSMSQLTAQLKEAFGPDFDVINEGDHVHVEPGPKMGAQLRAEAEGAGLPTTEEGISRLEAVRSGRMVIPAGLESETYITEEMMRAATPKLDYEGARDLLEEMAPRSTEARDALKELIAKGEDQAPSEIQRALAGLGDVFAQVGEQRLSPIEALFAGVGSGFKTRLAGREGEREAALERAKMLADLEARDEATGVERLGLVRGLAADAQNDTAFEKLRVQFGIDDRDFMRQLYTAMQKADAGDSVDLEGMLRNAQFNYNEAVKQAKDLGSRTDDNARKARANALQAVRELQAVQILSGFSPISDPSVTIGDITTFISDAEKADGGGSGSGVIQVTPEELSAGGS